MKLTDMKTIHDLMEWIEENVPSDKRMHEDVRSEAEWFLAYNQAVGYSDARIKDLAWLWLDGVDTLKGNDEVANAIIEDFEMNYGDELEECFGDEIRLHFGMSAS